MMDDAKALQLARDAYSGSTTYFDANVRNDLEKDLRQFQSRHSPDSKYMAESYRSRSRFYRPKTRAMVRSAEATAAEAFFSTSDVVSIVPEQSSDEMQQASAEIMQELLQYRMTKSIPWFQTVIGAYQDAMVQGVVISHQDWEYNLEKGIDRPVVQLIPRENFRFDPAADWTDPIGTSPYLIWLMPMRVRDIKARMKPAQSGQPAKWIKYEDAAIKKSSQSWDSTRMIREGNRTDSTDTTTNINDFSIVWVHMNLIQDEVTGQDMIFYTLGTDLLLSHPISLDERYATRRRPFVMGKSVIETHRTDGPGDVRLTREVQGETNEIVNQRIDNVKFAMNKRYFVKRNKQVDIRSLTRNVPGSVTMLTDIETDVKVLDTPDVTSSAYQEQDRLNMDFDEISGNMSQSSVQANRRLNETVGGMEILSADANKVRAYSLKTFIETWVEPVLRQLVLLEQTYETSDVLLAQAGAKSSMFQNLGMDAVTDELLLQELTLTINVGMNATSPTQKINNLLTGINGVKAALGDGVLEKYGVDPTEVVKEIFGALGHKDGGRFFKFEGEQDPRIIALEKEKEQLQAALDAKYPPELMAAQIKEIEARIGKTDADKVAKMVEAIYSSMQAGEVIASAPQVAPVADEIMKAGGYQAPNPVGVDPNFPQPEPMQQVGMQAAAAGPVDIPESGNTSPMFPARAGQADDGMNAGIETEAYANGGVIDSLANLPQQAIDAGREYMGRVGPAWSAENAAFEQTNPNFGDRVVRAVNPLTGLGSAVGAMHDAAGNGDKTGMAVAGVQAIPAMAAARVVTSPAVGASKELVRSAIPSAKNTAAAVLGSALTGAAADTYDKDKGK